MDTSARYRKAVVLRSLKENVWAGMQMVGRRAGRGAQRKIFAVGLNKTGTTSLHMLFQSLGLKSFHGPEWRTCENIRMLRSYDCFSDGPPSDLAHLDRMFPGSKFILNVRELEPWIYSRLAHIERKKQVGRYKGGALWDTTEHAVKYWIKHRNVHHLGTITYFSERPSDLLIVNFIRDESAAQKVCRFLGYDGRYQKPRENINPEKQYPARHKKLVSSCIAALGIQQIELSYDILAPSLMSREMRDRFPVDTECLRSEHVCS